MVNWTVYCGDCRLFTDVSFAHVLITDPPYRSHVHKKAVSQSPGRGVRVRDFGFDHLSPELRSYVAFAAASVQRWGIVYSDVESLAWLRIACTAAGALYVRTLPWIRWSMPQLSGDRPTTGWEALQVTYGHGRGRKHWNGPGNLLSLRHEAEAELQGLGVPDAIEHKCLRGEGKHKAEKPLDQALDLVAWFSDPGETVYDPFAGSGVIGLACRMLGRNYVGVELNHEWGAKALNRIYSPLGDRDTERLRRWLEQDPENEKLLQVPG